MGAWAICVHDQEAGNMAKSKKKQPVKARAGFFTKILIVLLLAVLVFCAWFSEPRRIQFSDPDMGTAFFELKKLDPQVLVVYRPTDLYVVVTLFGKEAAEDHVRRPRKKLIS